MGHTISELLIAILFALGIGKVSDKMQAQQYYATLESGKIIQIEIDRFNRYACPKYCSVPHFHRVHICTDKESKTENVFQLTSIKGQTDQFHIMDEPIIALLEVSAGKKERNSKPRMPVDFGQNFPWK